MMNENNLNELWKRCLDIIADNVPATAFKTWFSNTKPASYAGNVLTIFVPSQFVYEYIEEHFVDLLSSAIYRIFGNTTQLNYRILTDGQNQLTVDQESVKRPSNTPQEQQKSTNQTPGSIAVPVQDLDPMLKSNYSFENFIEGLSNKLPRTAAESIALKPGKTVFNPLFLYGASGVGKTHLANAIGLKVKELYPEKRVLYVSAHLFKVQYTDSVRKNTLNDFINFYQSIDVLIIDDIQEFVGVEKTQNTFFHIFNHLHQNRKQLILTSDRAPIMLQGMEERMLTRFKWGLVAEMEKPDKELRKNILINKIHRDGLSIPENVINYIAENVNESVRELEGIINSLLAQSILLKREIDMDLAERIVRKTVRIIESKPLTIEEIVDKVCEHYKLDVSVLNSKSRKREVVQVRQIAMFLVKKHTEISTSKIGHFIGNRDHATVLHACKIVKDLVEVDKDIKAEIEEIEMSFRK